MISSARLPFHPRPLKPDEFSIGEVQLFHSPKCGRIVQIAGGTPSLIFAMLCEFDPSIDAYVERPRQIKIGTRAFDISFWLRHADGAVRYALLTTNSMLIPPGWYAAADAMHLRKAARRIGIDLFFVLESKVVEQSAVGQACLRMLPLVQAARRLPEYRVLREQICRLIKRAPHRRVSQLAREFEDVEVGHVQAVVCDLIHGGVLRMDRTSVPSVRACTDGGTHG